MGRAKVSLQREGAMSEEICRQRVTKVKTRHRKDTKNQCVGHAELVIDVSNHGERVGACDEVLLDHDCSSSTCSFETASAALEHHVSGRDSSSKVHPTILDNCRKTIAVGSCIRNFAGRMRDVRVVGVRQELNRAGTGEQSQVSPVTR